MAHLMRWVSIVPHTNTLRLPQLPKLAAHTATVELQCLIGSREAAVAHVRTCASCADLCFFLSLLVTKLRVATTIAAALVPAKPGLEVFARYS